MKRKKSFEKRKKAISVAGNYRMCWNFLKESRFFIFAAAGIFIVFFILGFFISPPGNLAEQLVNYLKQILAGIKGLNALQLVSFIFFNNAKTSFFGMFIGILAGLFPVFVSAFNGYLLGFVSRLSVNADGFLVLWRLLPHGVFELPAVLISMGIGMKLGAVLLKERENLKRNLYESLRVFILVVIPLLIIAAIIEGSLIYFFGS